MTKNPLTEFSSERRAQLKSNTEPRIADAAMEFIIESGKRKYSYNFDWLSRPIIQYPQDMVAMQELIWSIRPDLIVETGIAHGGSAIMSASLLAMIEYCDAAVAGEMLDPSKPERRVVAVDIDIRPHNRELIEAHPMANRIDMIEGSSTDEHIVAPGAGAAEQANTVLVCLDSNHTGDHVLAELEAYAPMTTPGSYCVVFDTIVEDIPAEMSNDRPGRRATVPRAPFSTISSCLRPKADRSRRQTAALRYRQGHRQQAADQCCAGRLSEAPRSLGGSRARHRSEPLSPGRHRRPHAARTKRHRQALCRCRTGDCRTWWHPGPGLVLFPSISKISVPRLRRAR